MSIPEMDLAMPIQSFSRQAGLPNQPKTSSGKYRFTVSHVDVNGLVGGRS